MTGVGGLKAEASAFPGSPEAGAEEWGPGSVGQCRGPSLSSVVHLGMGWLEWLECLGFFN